MPQDQHVGRTRPQLTRALLRTRTWQLRFAGALPAGILAGAWFGDNEAHRVAFGTVFTAGFLLGVWIWLWSAASEEAEIIELTGWGRSRGLTFEELPEPGRATPLLREGESRIAEHGLVGDLRGKPLLICHFTYTVTGVGDEGHTVSARAPFTIARVGEIDTPADGLVLHPTPSGLDRGLRKKRSSLPGGRVVELESAAMQRGYKLEASGGVTENAIRRLFEPSFIAWCVDERDVLFELEGGALVVAWPGHRTDPSELDDLLERTRWLLEQVTAASYRTTA